MAPTTNSLVDALSMKGGKGEHSYDTNSGYQRSAFCDVQHVVVDGLKKTIINLKSPKYLKLVDLGCSSGRNTFLAMSNMVNTIIESYEKNGQNPPEIDCCLNDLLENDFNTVFKLIPYFHENLERDAKGKCFVSGVPGSFYSRLVPSQSLHFVHSFFSLHWLSKVPQGLEKNTKSLHIGQECPPNIYKSYLNQFKNDFTLLLKLRSEELVSNGQMVLTLIGRKVADSSTDSFQVWSLLSDCLLDLVSEGIVEESEMESFNMPFYNPNEEEVKEVVEKEGSFIVNKIEKYDHIVPYKIVKNDQEQRAPLIEAGKDRAAGIRCLVEPLVIAHFGEAVLEPLFDKYTHYMANYLSLSNHRPNMTLNIVLSLTRK